MLKSMNQFVRSVNYIQNYQILYLFEPKRNDFSKVILTMVRASLQSGFL